MSLRTYHLVCLYKEPLLPEPQLTLLITTHDLHQHHLTVVFSSRFDHHARACFLSLSLPVYSLFHCTLDTSYRVLLDSLLASDILYLLQSPPSPVCLYSQRVLTRPPHALSFQFVFCPRFCPSTCSTLICPCLHFSPHTPDLHVLLYLSHFPAWTPSLHHPSPNSNPEHQFFLLPPCLSTSSLVSSYCIFLPYFGFLYPLPPYIVFHPIPWRADHSPGYFPSGTLTTSQLRANLVFNIFLPLISLQ